MNHRNYNNNPGCFTGLLELFAATAVYQWMQSRFGFGNRSCCGCGCGCGMVLFCIFIMVVLSIFFNVDWTRSSF